MSKFVQAFWLSGLLFVSACGGGSSSGGGSGETYTGTYSVTLSTGSSLARGSGTFTAVVSGNKVTVTFDDGTIFTGQFNPAGIARSDDRSIVGVVEGCTSGTIHVSILGRPDDGTIDGVIGGDAIVCDGTNFSIVGSLDGAISQ